jgi:hypothetical protein
MKNEGGEDTVRQQIEQNGQLHARVALAPQKSPDTYCIRDWVGPRAGLRRCGIEKNNLLLLEIKPQSSSAYPVAIPTGLSWLQWFRGTISKNCLDIWGKPRTLWTRTACLLAKIWIQHLSVRSSSATHATANEFEIRIFFLLPPYSGARSHIGAQGWFLSFLIFHRR